MEKKVELAKGISSNRGLLMGVAMAFIIMCHQPFLSSLPFYFLHFCGHFGVDVFLFLSGFGCVFSLTKNSTIQFYGRRLVRLLPAIIICGIIKYLLLFIPIAPFTSLNQNALMIFGWDLWFFRPLIVFYFISPILLRIIDKGKYWCIICGIIIIILAIIGINISRFGKYFQWSISRLPAFYFGMLVAKGYFKSKRIILLGLLFLLLALICRAVGLKHFLGINELYSIVLFSLSIPSLCYWEGVIFKLGFCKKNGLNGAFLFIGSISLELYIWHEYVFSLLDCFNYNRVVLFTIAIFISFSLAYLTHRVLQSIHIK